MLEMMIIKSDEMPRGEAVFQQTAATQTLSWVVPDGVYDISVVCVGHGTFGGGGLSYRNHIEVTPGETLSIAFSRSTTNVSNGGSTRLLRGTTVLCIAYSGGYSTTGNTNAADVLGGLGGTAASSVNDGGGNGGRGWNVLGSSRYAGGGAGGYSGAGGNAVASSTGNTAGTVGAGAGSGARSYSTSSAAASRTGGSVGIFGRGADGATATTGTLSNGNVGSPASVNCGGGVYSTTASFNGGARIIYGRDRSFPDLAGA